MGWTAFLGWGIHDRQAVQMGLGSFALQSSRRPSNLRGVRENPTPTDGVAAWYEKEETARWKSREGGQAGCSPGDSEQISAPPTEDQPFQKTLAQDQDHQETQGASQEKGQRGSEGQEDKKRDRPEKPGKGSVPSARRRGVAVAAAGGRH